MDEHALRELIQDVKAGRMSRRHFVHTMVGLGLTAPLAAQMLGAAGVAQAQPKPADFVADQAGRRRAPQDALVAGPDAPQSPLRHRHQGPGRRPHLLRAARGLRSRRQRDARPRRRGPERHRRHARQGPHLGDVAAQEGRDLARRQALHRRRRRVHLGIRHRPRHGRAHHRVVPGDLEGRRARQSHGEGDLRQAPVVLGRRVLRQPRADPPQARLRALQGREVAGGAGEPQARRHRPVPLRGLQAGRRGPRATPSPATTCRTGPSSTRSR